MIDIEPSLKHGFRDGAPIPIERGSATIVFWNGNRPGNGIHDINGTLQFRSHKYDLSSSWSDLLSQQRMDLEWFPGSGRRVRPFRSVSPWYESGFEIPTLTSIVFPFWHNHKMYALIQTEDIHYKSTQTLQAGAFGRGALAVSQNGFDKFKFLKLDNREEYGPHWSPILESFQSQEETLPDDPIDTYFGMTGIALSSAIIRDNYVYMFYNRFLNTSRYNSELGGYPGYGFPDSISRLPPPSIDTPPSQAADRAYKKWTLENFNGICLARMRLTDFKVEKYYEKQEGQSEWTGENWIWNPKVTSMWTNNLSTKIIPDGSYPHVHWNTEIGKYVLVCQGDAPFPAEQYVPKVVWYTSDNLIDWKYQGILFQWDKPCFYPSIININGKTNRYADKKCILVWTTPIEGQNRGCKTIIRISDYATT